ncbi:hypothetical protein OG349_00315 [Streptomyces sp. NBC_01317]|uniref:hypothetical protein n=1 Tax=Streptomyces sp. NBC_01317 TaxID=2903822 RepID=UPI002E0E08AB|nr:hypothetical protein OG349_00315 [Streptomyces sp. NBC_01317]
MAFLKMLTTVAEPCVVDSPTGEDPIPEGDRPQLHEERIGRAPSTWLIPPPPASEEP